MFENGSHPGPLENAKMTRFKQAEYAESSKYWTVIVDEHKTTSHQGPAELAMDKRLFRYTQLYVNHLRPCFVASGEDHVFIKGNGYAFRKGTIGRRVKEVFKRAVARLNVSVTASRIRKTYSSSAAEMSPTKKHTINTHMKHKESTADLNYVLKINSKRASAAHQLMRNIIKEDDQDQAEPTTSSSKGPKSTSATECKSKPTDTDSDDNEPLEDVLGKPEEVDHAATAEEDDPTNQLDALDKVVIASVFKQEIEAGQLLTRYEVQVKMRTDQHLRKYVVRKTKVQKDL